MERGGTGIYGHYFYPVLSHPARPIIIPQMFNLFGKKKATVQLKSDPTVRRSHISPDGLVSVPDDEGVKTMADIFSYTVSASLLIQPLCTK